MPIQHAAAGAYDVLRTCLVILDVPSSAPARSSDSCHLSAGCVIQTGPPAGGQQGCGGGLPAPCRDREAWQAISSRAETIKVNF